MKTNSNTITAIVDTNYILNHLDLFLPSVDIQPLNKKFQIILLPPVVQELDGLKNKRGEVGFKAREFNRRLNKILTSREKTLCGYEINDQCILNLPNFHIDQNQNIKSMDNLILSYAKEFKRIYGKELNLYFLTEDLHFQNKVINESFNYKLPIFFITDFDRSEAYAMDSIINEIIESDPANNSGFIFTETLMWSKEHKKQLTYRDGPLYEQLLKDIKFIKNTNHYLSYQKTKDDIYNKKRIQKEFEEQKRDYNKKIRKAILIPLLIVLFIVIIILITKFELWAVIIFFGILIFYLVGPFFLR